MAPTMSSVPHAPTDKIRAEIIALKSYGIPVKEIASYVGIDDKTMSKYYSVEMREGALAAHSKVASFLFDAASGAALEKGATYSDCLRSSMFYLKTRMGWRENDPAPVATDNEIKITYEVIK